MMKRASALVASAALIGVLAAPAAWATNGMDMIGYGTRAIGMGGADVAVDGDASSLGGNPAVIAGLVPSSATVGLTALMPVLKYKDPMQSIDGKKEVFYMPSLGYVHSSGPWAFGVGAFAQGGMGVHFDGVQAFPGAAGDQLMSEVGFMRINPAVAYRVSNELSLGATLLIGYAKAKFSYLPETYSPGPDGTPGTADDFGGMKVKGLESWGYGAKIGAQYRIGDQVRLGASYMSKSKIDLDGGTATLNFGPMGKPVYSAALEDFTWPQEVEFGVAYLPIKGLTLAGDVKWINWSKTINKPGLKVSNPPAGYPPAPFPSGDTYTFDMGWKDQWVYALGAEYAINPKHTFRCGLNFANNPVPDDKLNPLFPAIPTTHATVGYGINLGKVTLDLAWEHAFEKTQKNSNPATPFEISHYQNTLSFDATYHY
jgi:long-chain fatty acid transport protein